MGLRSREAFVRNIPAYAGVLFAVVWMLIFGYGGNALEGTRFDVMATIRGLGMPLRVIVGFALGYGIAIGSGVMVWRALHVRLTRRAERRRLGLCTACGYDLSGSRRGAPCPECGAARS